MGYNSIADNAGLS